MLQIEAQKQSMRARVRAIRREIPLSAREEAAERVAKAGLGFLNTAAGLLAAYFPVRSEFDCLPLIRRLADDHWELALPVISGSEPLQFRRWTPGDPMCVGPFGILEPTGGSPISPRVLLVPLLAFDRRCYRLGYGGGHYDRTLASLRHEASVVGIGLAFDEQEVEEVPVCPYDERLDWIVTPSGPIRAQEIT